MAWRNIDLIGFTNIFFTQNGLDQCVSNAQWSCLNRDLSIYVEQTGSLNPQSYNVDDIMWNSGTGITVVKSDANNTNSFKVFLNSTQIYSRNNGNRNFYYSAVGFIVDDDTKKVKVIAQTRQYPDTGNNDRTYTNSDNPSTLETELYYALINAEYKIYNWRSVKSLKLATAEDFGLPIDNPNLPPLNNSTMLLSYIPDEYLNNGEPVTNGHNFVIKNPSLPDYVTEYNDTTPTTRTFFLKSKKMCKISRQLVGLGSEQYTITLVSPDNQFIYFSTTITIGLGDGIPYLGFIIDDENTVAQLNVIFVITQYDSSTGLETRVTSYNTISHTGGDRTSIYAWLHGDAGDDDDSADVTENPIQGNDETDPVINEPLNRPSLPTKGAVGSGFVKLYDISDSKLQELCDFMWDDSLLTNLGRLFNDPREIIVGIMVFPFKPTHVTNDVTIYAGNLSTGIQADLLNNEYEQFFGGSCRVPKGNSNFMSFAPYRKMKLFIPYCGEHELDPSAVYGSTLKLYYYISFFSGNCIAIVSRTREGSNIEEYLWFYGGQIAFQIPMSGEDFTRTISSLITAGVSIGGALATGGASMAAAGVGKNADLAQGVVRAQTGAKVAKGVAGAANGSMAPSVSYSSGGGASSGFLSTQQPHITIEEAIPAFDGDQHEYIGNTFYKTMKLDDCNGYTKCFEQHIEGLSATENELSEIDDWLTNGVIINHDGSTTPSDTPSVAGNTVITFMKCSSERNVIGKKWSDETAIEGKLIYDQSIETPSIIIDGDVIGKNYAYIGLFKRFYYISDIKILKNSRMQIDLKSDPLQSFAEGILDCSAAVDRQASNGNAFIEDPYMWTQINKEVSTLTFKDGGLPVDFDHTTDTYILTIAGH